MRSQRRKGELVVDRRSSIGLWSARKRLGLSFSLFIVGIHLSLLFKCVDSRSEDRSMTQVYNIDNHSGADHQRLGEGLYLPIFMSIPLVSLRSPRMLPLSLLRDKSSKEMTSSSESDSSPFEPCLKILFGACPWFPLPCLSPGCLHPRFVAKSSERKSIVSKHSCVLSNWSDFCWVEQRPYLGDVNDMTRREWVSSSCTLTITIYHQSTLKSTKWSGRDLSKIAAKAIQECPLGGRMGMVSG